MSKRKRDISYLKPEEPAFISRMKAQAGYKEGPTVDTKRESLAYDESDSDDHDEEQPQVVVVKEGDLTAEEASEAKREKEEGPADLNQRVVFRKPDKSKKADVSSADSSEPSNIDSTESKRSKVEGSKKQSQTKSVLSFAEDEDEES
ncbi:hypothetical protein ONE63_001373 [Megalurothrips usitatus]|uniref:DUF4604 domain-containing protein n=1 Tax=Megalurothrips usitatus TaxID=439358 RepID=A0AAV7XFQ0_9NEOP|nr:hypothetical protein ONE63_001373 [Megalurothrips usitatus]